MRSFQEQNHVANQEMSLPTIERPKMKKKPAKKQVRDPLAGYVKRRVDLKMTRDQGEILKRKLLQLQETGATTADGKEISDYSQALRWILENEVQL